MNTTFKKINIEDCLFFDGEMVSLNPELKIDSKEYDLWQWKNRDKNTDEFLSDEELQRLYKRTSALKIGYNKVVTVGVGFVKDNNVRVKALKGDEKDILMEFFKYASKFKYLVSFNGIGFDMPVFIANGNKHFDVTEYLIDSHNVSQKKSWDLKSHIDLIEVIKGSHYNNLSFDECCYMYGVKSPKEGDIKGDKVTETYYTIGINPILDYVKKDVFSLINLFRATRHEVQFENYVDVSESQEEVSNKTPLQTLYEQKEISVEFQNYIKGLLAEKKPTAKEKKILKDILQTLSIQEQQFIVGEVEIIYADKADVKEQKIKLINELIG